MPLPHTKAYQIKSYWCMFVIKTKKLNVMGGFWMMKENRQL